MWVPDIHVMITWLLTHSHLELHQNLTSASLILLKINWEESESSQNIWRRVVVWLPINISPSNVFQKMLLKVIYFQICQACFGCSECEWVKVLQDPSLQTYLARLYLLDSQSYDHRYRMPLYRKMSWHLGTGDNLIDRTDDNQPHRYRHDSPPPHHTWRSRRDSNLCTAR